MTQKIILYSLFLTLIIGGMLLFIIASKRDNAYRTSGPIIAFGDSLIEGFGSLNGKNLVNILEDRIGEPIISAGVGGNTTHDALLRLDQDVLAHEPRIVIILLGGNDAIQQKPIDETFSNLSEIIDQIQANKSQVLLLGIQSGGSIDTYASRFEQLAKEKRVTYVSDVLSGIYGDSKYMYDQIHPNDAGYERIADRVEPELKKMRAL